MTDVTRSTRLTCPPLCAVGMLVLLVLFAAPASAQSFVSPFIGYNFGGDSGCPTVTNCEDKQLNAGLAVGRLGNLIGFETEIGYARDFFGDSPDVASSLLTVMGNMMLVPNLGPLRPYGLVGLGLMRTRVELDAESILAAENQVAWNVGAGAMVLFGEHVGLRGDIRYFHSLQELPVVNVDIGGERIDFGRASVALLLRF
jgi:opacity protein-like surface antigen